MARLFPCEAGFEAYLGMPIIASDGRVLGHLAVLNKHPLGDEVMAERIYRIFLARAGAEMERIQVLARLAFAASVVDPKAAVAEVNRPCAAT